MPGLPPIATLHLFPKLDTALLELLGTLPESAWQKPTIAGNWTIKDIVAHLLDGNLRTLSMLKDGYFGEKPENVEQYSDLVAFLNQLNADWTRAMRRLSPRVLTEWLALSGKEAQEFLVTLPPDEKAVFSVAWAGEEHSPNWFHVAREYTEKWHHQQQIRLALGQTAPLYQRAFYFPYLRVSMRALPHHYRQVQAERGDTIQISVSGDSGGHWWLTFLGSHWELAEEENIGHKVVCQVIIPPEIAWRLLTRGITTEEARPHIEIKGKTTLGEPIFLARAVMV